MEFEERLVYLRNKRDMSQYEVAAKLNVDRSRYCKWEQGKSRPSYEMLAQIADFFGVTTDYLLGRTDRPELHIEEVQAEAGIAQVHTSVDLTDEEKIRLKEFLKSMEE